MLAPTVWRILSDLSKKGLIEKQAMDEVLNIQGNSRLQSIIFEPFILTPKTQSNHLQKKPQHDPASW